MHRFIAWFVIVLVASGVRSQSSRSSEIGTNVMIAQEVVIRGTTTLDSQQLNEIKDSIAGKKMDESEEEVTQRVRDAFMDRGYLLADVSNVKIRPLDPLARPKTVRIEADVAEGARFKVGVIKFSGTRQISYEELRKSFPVKIGDLYSIGKLRSGMDYMRKLYGSRGYLDCYAIPNVRVVNGDVAETTFEVNEGPQYRMGVLELVGKPDEVDSLQQRWKLRPGEPFDVYYLETFLNENRSLLPAEFSAENDAYTLRDCEQLTVKVHIELDPKRPWKARPQDVECKTEKTDK